MPDIYTEVTLEEFSNRLAEKLGDAGKVFWPDAELTELLNEALQTWAAFSGYWTERKLLTLRAGVTIYDLPAEAELSATLGYTATQPTLLRQIKRVLLEPDASGSYEEQFDNPSVAFPSACQSAYERWLLMSGLITRYQELAGQPVIPLPERHLEFRFVEWKARPAVDPTTHFYTRLLETTTDSTYYDFYAVNGQPKAYVPLMQPVNSVRVLPTPEDVGELAFFNLQLPTPTELESQAIPIPPALNWVLKYAALQILFGVDGQVRDPFRAQYCESRVADAEVLGRNFPATYNAWLNGVPIRLGTLRDLAARYPYWHTDTGTPRSIALLSWNHLIAHPTPTSAMLASAPQTLELELQTAPPILVDPTDTVQLPRNYHELIVNFAHHLAMLKLGGAEFTKTMSAYRELLEAALDYNSRLRQQQSSLWLFKKRATADYQRQPRFGDARDDEQGQLNMKQGGRG